MQSVNEWLTNVTLVLCHLKSSWGIYCTNCPFMNFGLACLSHTGHSILLFIIVQLLTATKTQ